MNQRCSVIHVRGAGEQTLEIFLTTAVCTFPRAFTMPLRCLSQPATVMTNIIYANVIRPGNPIAALGVAAEIYHRTRRDSKASIKILDFSGLDLPVINKAGEERKVCLSNGLIFGVLCPTWKRSDRDAQVETRMQEAETGTALVWGGGEAWWKISAGSWTGMDVRVLRRLRFPFKESFSCVKEPRTSCCLKVQLLPGQDDPSDRRRSEFTSHRVCCSACLHAEL